MDTVLPATELGDRDVSVGDLVEERLGKEVVDRLVEPLLGGVYAGHAREISARAAVPQLVALLDRDRSLTRGGGRALPPPDADAGAGLRRPPWGSRSAPRRTRRGIRRARCGPAPRSATWPAAPDGGWNLVVGPTRDPEVVRADAVVLATPARATARLLSDVAPSAALTLARIEYASMAIVTLAVPGRERSPTSPGRASWCHRSTGAR